MTIEGQSVFLDPMSKRDVIVYHYVRKNGFRYGTLEPHQCESLLEASLEQIMLYFRLTSLLRCQMLLRFFASSRYWRREALLAMAN